MSKNKKIKLKYFGNCLSHGYTEFYKNGKCKECMKYDKYWKKRFNLDKYKDLNVTEVQK